MVQIWGQIQTTIQGAEQVAHKKTFLKRYNELGELGVNPLAGRRQCFAYEVLMLQLTHL